MTTLETVLLALVVILGALVLLLFISFWSVDDKIEKLNDSIHVMEQDNINKHVEQHNTLVEYINGVYKSIYDMEILIDKQKIDIKNLKDNKIDKSYEDIELEELERYCPIIDKSVQDRINSMKRD